MIKQIQQTKRLQTNQILALDNLEMVDTPLNA